VSFLNHGLTGTSRSMPSGHILMRRAGFPAIQL
jgi:hypothetical protein